MLPFPYPSESFGDVGDEAGFDESDCVLLCWLPLPGGGVDVSAGIRPSLILFFCFMRRFWNQILTCVSFSCRDCAISILRARVRYLLKWNSFSNSVSCFVVKFVRPVLLLLAAAPMPPGTLRLGDVVQLTKFGLPPDAWPLNGKAASTVALFAAKFIRTERQRGGK